MHGRVNISWPDFFLIFVPEFLIMLKHLYISLVISMIAQIALGQETPKVETESEVYNTLFDEKKNGGEVKIVQEEKLDEILYMFIEQNRKLEGIPCYWIRIYSGSSHNAREEAYKIKGKFLRKYEGIRNEVIYDDPNFKVYIGGYRSKSETLKLLNKIKKDFYTAFMVYDIIDFPQKPVDLQEDE